MPHHLKVLIALCCSPVLLAASELQVNDYSGSIKFYADTTMPAINVQGEIKQDILARAHFDSSGQLSSLEMELAPDSFNTGMGLRDRHLRSRVLDDRPFRFIATGPCLSEDESNDLSKLSCTVLGEVEVANQTGPLKVTFTHDQHFENIHSQIPLSFEQLKIEAPGHLGVRVKDDIAVELHLSKKE